MQNRTKKRKSRRSFFWKGKQICKRTKCKNSKKQMNRANANKHIWPCLPPKRHVASLLLNIKHLGSLSIFLSLEISLSPLTTSGIFETFSPPQYFFSLGVIYLSYKLWCDLSLPLWHQFPRRVSSLSHSTKHLYKCDACRGQDSLSGAGSEETQNKGQTVFPVVKSVAPSGMLRLYRKDSVGPKTINRWNRVHCRENTCHLSSLDM